MRTIGVVVVVLACACGGPQAAVATDPGCPRGMTHDDRGDCADPLPLRAMEAECGEADEIQARYIERCQLSDPASERARLAERKAAIEREGAAIDYDAWAQKCRRIADGLRRSADKLGCTVL